MAGKRLLTVNELEAGAKALTEPKYLQAKVDLSIDISEPIPVLKMGDCTIFSRGDISTIGGRAKSKKTLLSVLFATDFLKSSDAGKILLIDAEMGKHRAYKTARRIHKMMEWNIHQNHERLTVLSLREYAPDERVAIFKEAIEHLCPVLVFLDGVRDLVASVNSEEEATKTVGMLMKMTVEYDCHICSILHENGADGKLRGWVGTEITNKSESVLTVTKIDEKTSTVEPKYTRGAPFEAFTFRINDDGLPEYCDMPVVPIKTDKMRQLFQSILPNGVTLSYSDLRSKVMATGNIKISAAQNRISEAVSSGIIIKEQGGGYYFSKPQSDENTIPF